MRKNTVGILVVALAILLVAPSVMAQTSPTDVVQGYYAALGQAATSGDFTALLDLFADDATITIPVLSPEPVSGKDAIQSTMGGMLTMLQGLEVTVGDMAVEGDQVTVSYTLSVAAMEQPIPATDTFVIQDGMIQSLTIDIAAEALGPVPTPYDLPETGGPVGSLLPGLLVLGGAALVGLGRRFSR